MKRCAAIACFILTAQAGLALAQSAEPIAYTVRFPAPHTHYVSIEASIPTGGRPQIELMMAVWTPGSYLVREFARHVEAVNARTENVAIQAVLSCTPPASTQAETGTPEMAFGISTCQQ